MIVVRIVRCIAFSCAGSHRRATRWLCDARQRVADQKRPSTSGKMQWELRHPDVEDSRREIPFDGGIKQGRINTSQDGARSRGTAPFIAGDRKRFAKTRPRQARRSSKRSRPCSGKLCRARSGWIGHISVCDLEPRSWFQPRRACGAAVRRAESP